MTENDDILIEAFFREAREEQLPDDGFSQRVMARLAEGCAITDACPSLHRQQTLSRWWTAICVTVAVAVFTIIGGWQLTAKALLTVMTTIPTTEQIARLAVCGAVITIIAAMELIQREHITLREGY